MSRWSVAAAGLIVLGCATTLERQAMMFRHFGEARTIGQAAIFDRSEAVQAPAQALLDESFAPGLPPEADPYVQTIQDEVRPLAEGRPDVDLPGAAARLAVACGQCHAAQGAGPNFGSMQPPTGRDLRGHMSVHAWGTERMWEGLISASDALWVEGARALQGEQIRPEDFAPRLSDPDVAFLMSSRVHQLAEQAEETSGWEARAEVMAELWASCARCHAVVRVGGPE